MSNLRKEGGIGVLTFLPPEEHMRLKLYATRVGVPLATVCRSAIVELLERKAAEKPELVAS